MQSFRGTSSNAPSFLALLCTLDIVMTLSLSLLCIDKGRVWQALAPDTDDWKLNSAAQLYDLALLALLRTTLSLAPVCGVAWVTTVCGALVYALITTISSGWLIGKVVIGVQYASDGVLLIESTGVVLSIATLAAAEVWGALVGWLQFCVVICTRDIITRPYRPYDDLPYYYGSMYASRHSVEDWLSSASASAAADTDLQTPLIDTSASARLHAPAPTAPTPQQSQPHVAKAHQEPSSETTITVKPAPAPVKAPAALPPAGPTPAASSVARLAKVTQGRLHIHVPGDDADTAGTSMDLPMMLGTSPSGALSFLTGRSSPTLSFASAGSFVSAVSANTSSTAGHHFSGSQPAAAGDLAPQRGVGDAAAVGRARGAVPLPVH